MTSIARRPDVGNPARRRRLTSSADPLEKVTVRLHASVSSAIRNLVSAGNTPSAGAFIEDAVMARLRELRQEKVYAAYAAAADDQAFMADMTTTTEAFEATVRDGLEA